MALNLSWASSLIGSACDGGREGEGAISSKDQRVNEEIRAREVRLIDAKGAQIGVVPTAEALQIARERGTDLVEVAPNADPPVCRLMNYGKFLYERAKKEREARKSQKQTEVKEIRLRPKTGEHDIAYKLRDARRFLQKGAKVKVRIRFRGREVTHPELARELLDRVAKDLSDVAVVEQEGHMEGHTMLMILSPDRG
jgi:translation initiation factor IF-3